LEKFVVYGLLFMVLGAENFPGKLNIAAERDHNHQTKNYKHCLFIPKISGHIAFLLPFIVIA